MMMTGSVVLAVLLTARSTSAFVTKTTSSSSKYFLTKRYLGGSASSTGVSVESGVSRIGTLQTLLSKHGAPGSVGCQQPDNDLVPVESLQDTPELVSLLTMPRSDELANLHPYLYPIAKSKSTDNFICAYRNPFIEESELQPWPIVETKLGAPGFSVLALNSEHFMRRIVAASCDFQGKDEDSVRLYNEGLGKGLLKDYALDAPYEPGSVAKLGYGPDKYVLLRVGPFPDLYQKMAQGHAARGDEQSSLIAAETTSSKVPGFASTFLFYSRLLKSFSNRDEEARDAARMCLRLPLPTIGWSYDDFKDVALLGLIAEESDSLEVALDKLKILYQKMKDAESEENDPNKGKTAEQVAIDEANTLIDMAALYGTSWAEIRPQVARQFRSIGRNNMADFIDFSGALV